MSQCRVIRASLTLLLLCAFPLIASAATTDFRILFDVDHDIATGCTVSTMPGVDQVFTTRVETTGSTGVVSQTFRQLCTGTSLGPQIPVDTTGWAAGFQSSSGQLLVETRIPFAAFPDTTTPRNMRVGLVGSQGSTVHTALVRPNGDMVFFPAPSRGRRRAVAAPGAPRLIVVDGNGADWNGLKAMFDGIGASGVPGLRIEKFFGFADTNRDILFFRFDANLSTSAPFAANDLYTRAIGSGLTVPGVNGEPTVLENDTDPNGLPLTATLVSQPAAGQVVLDATGGFTYTPTDANSDNDDSFEYRASNGAQDSNVATVTIAAQDVEVSGPNQEPSFNKGSDPVVLEDSGPQSLANWATGVTAGPDEDDDQNVTFVITNVTNPQFFDDPPTIAANGTLSFTPAANEFGISAVTVKIIDDGGTADGGDNESPTQTFFITIDPVNDVPSFVPGPAVVVEDNDGAQNLPWATGISPGPSNESTQVVDFILGNSNPSLFSVQPSIAPNGTLTFTPAPGQTGFANISVQIHDNGGTANGGVDTSSVFNLVLTVEKAPLITSANTTTFRVGVAGSFTVTTTGIPRPSISMTGTLPAGVTFVDGTGANKGTGVLSGTPAPGTGGSYALTFTATNVRGSSPVQNFTLIVCNNIVVTNPATTAAPAGAAFSQSFTQVGAVGSATFTLASGTLPAGMTLATNGTLSGTPTQLGSFPITVTVTDVNGCTGTGPTYNLTVVCPTINITNPVNATGTAGAAFSETFTQTGAVLPATFTTSSTLPAGLTLATNGVLSGTPTQTGSFPIVVTVTDGNNCTGTSTTYNLVIACQTITVTNPANTNGTAGAAFSETFTQTGAIGGATFSTASTLPAGLTLAANGVLSGTPTQTGTFPIVVTVTDGNGCTGTSTTYNLVIGCQVIGVFNPATTTGTVSAAFSQTFTQTGAIGTPVFTTASTLPAGLTLATNGVLSGTPTQPGTFPIVVTVTDGNGCTGTSATYNLVIGCQTIAVTNPSNSNVTVNTAVFEAFSQTGGVGTVTFTLATGTLPAGLTLNPDGSITGMPTQTGSFPITVTATDVNGCTGTSPTYTLVVACQTITVNNPANANGTANAAFSETFTQTGAIGSATFTLGSGTLPAGITLAANGVLSGTPTQTGSFPITVTVTDANGCTGTSATYTLVIACQTITVTNPANANGTAGAAFSETFTQTGAIGGATFTLGSGTLPAGITLATNGVLSGTPTQTGSFPITVLVTDGNGCTGTSATYTLVIACQTINVTNPANANGTAGAAFSETFTQTGAIGGATFTLGSGTLPAGITLAANGVLSGTPTQVGSFPITVTVTDGNGCTGTSATYTLVIACQTITVTNPANTNGTAGAAFSETFTQTSAIGSATFTLGSGTLPAGITLAANGVLSGTPTQTGSFPITVTVTDANGCTGTSATYTLVIACQTITVTNPSNANYAVNTAAFEVFSQTGGIGTVTFTLATGTLPAGLTLNANGSITGTPTQTGSFPITVTATDANGCTGTSSTYTLVVACQTITVTNPLNANGTANAAFSETFTQTGAIGSATFTLGSGTLPAGITLAANGVLSGTPTQTGSFPITVIVTDANGCTGTSAIYTLVIACQTITVTNPANASGTVNAAFSETFTQTGAIGSATFTLGSGTLPAGITLAANGVLSGTPTQTGSFPITVVVTDANGCTGTSATYTLVIGCQIITVTSPAISNGTAGSPFSETFTQTGGILPVTFTINSGTLPAGITLGTNGVLSGTPTQVGSFPITITATDANGCTGTSGTYTLVIGCQTISVTNPANANGTANAAFSETFTQTGAIGTATFTLGSGTLPAGITLAANGVLSGTPTQTGSFPITVTVTDSNGCTGTGATYTLVIACQTITVTNPANANGTVSAPFSETFTQTGSIGTATFTLGSGTLPAGITLATNGVLSGTPTQPGSFPITVTVTDSNGCTGTSATYTLVIACQTITVTNPANTTGPAGAPFSETFTQTGAIGTATFTTASTLPTGLTLSSAGVLSGTPSQGGTFPIVVTVTDSNGCTGTSATYPLTITCPVITVTNPANANGTANAAFSETFTQTGAIGTATFSLGSGTLPTGLTLDPFTGVLSGTPTQTGSFPITVLVTDGNGCTGVSATYTLVIACQTITVTNPANAAGVAGAAFSETFTQTGAIGTATFTVGSGTLPTGLTLATNGVLSGTPTQTGSFPITVTVTDSNGCTGTSATYTIVISCQTITVTNPANANGTILVAFSETFTQTGAIGTATFTTSDPLPAGLTLSSAGVLSGTPTVTGSFPITVTVTDSNGCTGTGATYTIVISCQTITVTNPANASGTVSSAFSETFTQTGANGGATFTLATGTLPSGITLAANGVLSGTPTQTGSFPITVLVTDGNSCTGTSATYTLVIGCQVITVTNPVNDTILVSAPFSETFTQVGAVGSATFTTASTLPAGLTLSTSGVLSGTPTESGTFPIVVTVTDANGCTGTGTTYNLVINCQTITVTNPGIDTGTVSTAFSQQFTQTGAIGTATFTTSDPLPAGLTLATDGTLSGVPTQSGTFPIVVTVTDSNGCTGTSATYTLIISCQVITVTNPANENGTAGVAFSETFTESGSVGAVTFTLASGTLPNGLTLSAAGVLSGTPTQNGTFPITVTVTDSNGCTGTGVTYNLVIACAPFVFTPTNTMPDATFGSAYSQNISTTGGTGPFTMTLANATTVPTSFTFTDNGNGSATIASANPTVTGVFTFDVNVLDTASNCTQTQTFSLTVIPNVVNDIYSAANGLTDSVGNTQAVAAGFSTPTTPYVNYTPSVLANDSAPAATLTVVTPSVTNAAGTITFNAAGGWSYIPTPGFTGTATFAFVVASNGAQANASVSIVVTNKVWYVDNSVGAGGTGLSSLPFKVLADAQTASAAGDIIYVDFGNGSTSDQAAGITLKDNQQLIGEGVALSVNGNALAAAGSKPLISGAATVVTLANGNTVKGLTTTGGVTGIGGTSVAGFTGDVLTIQNATGSGLALVTMTGTATVTNATITGNGTGVTVTGGTAVVNLDNTNTITANAGGRSILVQNRAVGAGNVNVGAAITDNGLGMLLTNNSVGTVAFTGTQTMGTTTNTAVALTTNSGTFAANFSGTLAITTSTGTGFTATGGGTVNVTGTANLTTGAAAAGLLINGVTVGASGVTFNSINTTGATTGVSLTSMGNGNVTINSGTLNAGTGVSLNTLGTSNVTLNNVTVVGTTTGISGTTFGTLTITGTVPVSGPTALALNTGTVTGTFSNVTSTGGTNGVSLTNVSGTWGATAGALSGASGATFNVSGGSGNITWGGTIAQANANRVVSVAGANSATINFNGNVTSSGTSTGVSLSASSGTYNFNGSNAFTGASGIVVANGQSGTVSFSNSTTNTVAGTPLQVDGSVTAVTTAITYGGTIVKVTAGFLIDVNNLDSPGTLVMTHTPAAAGNLSISNNGSTGISIINSSSTNITIANASVTFNNAGPGFTSTNNTGGTINLQGIALAGSGNRAGMLLAGAGTINVTTGVAAPSINMTGATNNAIDGTTTVFAGTLNLNNTAITGGAATAVRLGGGTLSGTGSVVTAGAQTALNLSGVALTNGAGMAITSTGGANGVILANVTGGTYTLTGSLTGHTTAAWTHTNTALNAATITYTGPITPAINARAVDIGAVGASTGLRGGTITFSGAITTTSNAANANAGGIRVRNSTGGTLTLSNATQSFTSNANTAIELTTNPGATFNFTGGSLTISSTTGKGFLGSGGGTVNVTGVNNTISTTGNNAFEVVGTAGVHFGGAYEWRSITSTNGVKGISLQFHDGPFIVTGDGVDGGTAPDSVTSGGTITGADQRGAEFVDVDGPVSINGMTFTNSADTAGPDATVAAGTCGSVASGGSNSGCYAGIHLDTVSNVTINLVNVTGSGQMGINGNAITNLTMQTVNVTNAGTSAQEDGIRMYNLGGTGGMTDVTVSTPFAMGINLENSTASLATELSPFLITNATITNSTAAQGAVFHTVNTGVAHVKFVGGSITGHFSVGIQTSSDVGATGTLGVYVDGTSFSNVAGAIHLQAGGGTHKFDIRNINMVARASGSSHSIMLKADSTGILTGKVYSNTIGNATAYSGAPAGSYPISVDARNTSQITAQIRGNTFRHADSGVEVGGGQGSSKVNLTVTGNRILDPEAATALAGIYANSGILNADSSCMTIQIGGTTAYPGAPTATEAEIQNRIEGSWPSASIRVIKSFGGSPPDPVFNLPGYDGSGVNAWIAARNSFVGAGTTVSSNAGAGGAFTNAASCP
jgi:hypothetical protein